MARLLVTATVLAATCVTAGGGFPADRVGTREARRTGFVGSDLPPEGIPEDAVVDEVTLVHLAPGSACFDVVVRAAPRVDVGLADLAPACRASDAESTATTSAEMVSVFDYDREGALDDVVMENVTADSYASSDPADPRPRIFRVIERTGRLCCAVDTSGSLALTLTGRDGEPVLFRWADD
jgi:hypothetical protein